MLHPFGEGVDAERGAIGIRQPVDGQAAGDVIDRGADPGDLRIVGVAVGHEELAKAMADEVSQRHLMLEARGEGDGVHVHQAGTAGAVLAPVDEDLPEASIGTLISGEIELLRADGHGGGVSAATPWHLPTNAYHHGAASELIYELTDCRATTERYSSS